MKPFPRIKPGDRVRFKPKHRRPGVFEALEKRVNSWTLRNVETGERLEWVGTSQLEKLP